MNNEKSYLVKIGQLIQEYRLHQNLTQAELAEKIDFKVIELVPIMPDKITKYVTEYGIVSPCDLNYYLCKEGV